ncbi:hypothetical protein Krac_0839 [Ktedonobacter racemifer DSM 44963]|uniref:Uncharacterized protein n=1 Tax=Ktedonobacter racemifer DSM 44963 TaxID=485913 RepID=D6U5J7_KTERA|nr:hypothetical protein Krac_0839 [Ktedonobacter racemifer DSM 44963]
MSSTTIACTLPICNTIPSFKHQQLKQIKPDYFSLFHLLVPQCTYFYNYNPSSSIPLLNIDFFVLLFFRDNTRRMLIPRKP